MSNSSFRHLTASTVRGIVSRSNYVKNATANENSAGWVAYANTPGVRPVDGTGGSPVTTITRNTSSPLANDADFLITKDAANRQGEGVSYNFTIDKLAQSQSIKIKFDYQASSLFGLSSGIVGSDSDIEVWAYDVTNSQLIAVVPYVLTTGVTSPATFIGSFQASANSTSYRLILHIPTTNANAWTFEFTNVDVSVSDNGISTSSPSVSAAVYLSATTSFGANSPILFDGIEFDTNNGYNPATGMYTIPVSGTYSFTTNISHTTATNRVWSLWKNGALYKALVQDISGLLDTGATLFQAKAGDTFFLAADASVTVSASAPPPIQVGMTFNLEAPSQSTADNKIITAKFGIDSTTSGTLATTSGSSIIFPFTYYDTNNAYNSSTGIYTVPVSGYYDFLASGFATAGAQTFFYIFVNGNIATSRLGDSTNLDISTCMQLKLIAGDVVTFVAGTSFGYLYIAASNSPTGVTPTIVVTKVQGPVQSSSNSNVSARVTGASGTLNGGSLSTPIQFSAVTFDTNNAFNLSTGQYTVPVSGKYLVRAYQFPTSNVTAGIYVFKNGVQWGILGQNAGTSVSEGGSDLVDCIAGDLLDVRGNAGSPSTIGDGGAFFTLIK